MIGRTVAQYKILEKLGEGGMGVVYKAQDTKLNRMVALKFLPPHLAASGQDKARFIQEAQAASALNHPNVCTIHDIQSNDDQMFIVMEYVDGQTLNERKGSLSAKQAIDIGIQIADGLAAAHEKGIVHRDLKPENIMIRKDGIVQIMDFGLAKLRGVSRLTKEGSTVGTAGYMSPELVQGLDADHRSDIFSLGIVLYEMFTGQLPFRGLHETALSYEIVNVDARPMSSVKPEIDPALDAVVLECLEKDPNERTQSAKQVSIDLNRVKRESSRQRASRIVPGGLMGGGASASPGIGSRATRTVNLFWPLLSGVLAIGLCVAVWSLWTSPKITRPVARFSIALPKDQSLEILSEPSVAVAPDGSRLVYKANGQLYQRRMQNFDAEPIPGTEDALGPFFSPDGRWIGFFAGGKLKKIQMSGGAAVVLADAPNSRGATWMNDGNIIYAPNGRGGLFRVKDDGGETQELTQVDTLKNERTHRWPHILPDGKTVIFTVGLMGSPDYYEDASIESMNLETGKRKTLLKGASSACYLQNGYLVFARLGTLFAVPFDPGRLETRGASFPLVNSVANDITTGATHYAISKSGLLVYIPGESSIEDRTLVLVDQLGNVTNPIGPPQSYVDPRISPDGKHVAVAVQSGKDFDIWMYDIQRGTPSRLTFGGSNRSPVWSPDSRRVAYSNNSAAGSNQATGKSSVVIIQADGSGVPEEIPINRDRNYVNCWSHDGATIIVTVPEQGMEWDLWALPVHGDRTPQTFLSTRFDESFASLSPDGKWIAYMSNETGSTQVYVRPFPHGNGKWQISTDIATRVEWSADGKTLYYSGKQGIMAVPVQATQSLIAQQPRVFLKGYHGVQVESALTFDVAPDGKRILVTRPKEGDEAYQHINVVLNWFEDIQDKAVSSK